MPLKCCIQYVSNFRKLGSDHRTRNSQSSIQFPRKEVLKNVQTTRQLQSSPMLVRLGSKSFKLGFSITWTENLQMFKQGLERQRNERSNIYLYFINYAEAFSCVNHNKLWKTLKKTILPVSWETRMWVKKQQSEHCMEKQTGSGLRKEHDKALYCHPV